MKRRLLLIACVLLVPVAGGAQEYRAPRDLAGLVSRVQEFWNDLANSQRLKALEFVLPDKRELFLAGGNMPFVQPKVVGIDFTSDTDHALVRISVRLLAKEAPGGYFSWTVTDSWVWRRNAWFLDIQDTKNLNPFQKDLGIQSKPLDRISKDLDSKFRLSQPVVDVGVVLQGERRKISIPIQYSGETPLSLEIKAVGDLVSFDRESSRITSASKEVPLWLHSESWEGPFALPVSLMIQYEGVIVERRVSIMGSMFAPVRFRQDPSPFRNSQGQELKVFIHNATGKPITVSSVSTDDRFEILELPASIPVNADGVVRLSRKADHADAPDHIFIRFAEPVNGRTIVAVPLRWISAP